MRLKRILFIGVLGMTIIFLIGSVGMWWFLSRWVPVNGKALLIQEVEQRAPVELTIGAMRYALFRGIILENIELRERESEALWLASPLTQIHLGWPSWLLRRQVVFRIESTLEHPCRTELSLRGRYRLRDPALTLQVRSTDIPLESLAPPLSRYVPPALRSGNAQMNVRIHQRTDQPLALSGTIEGTQLLWMTPTIQARGDVTVRGGASAPSEPNGRWIIEADLSLRHGAMQDLPTIKTLTDMEGHATLTGEHLEIHELSATALGSRWRLEGAVAPMKSAQFEGLLTSRVNLTAATQALPPPMRSLGRLQGDAQIRAVCRGPLTPQPLLDCLLHTEFEELTLTAPKLVEPITHMTGELAYDALARHVAIRHLEGRLLRETLSATGQVQLLPATRLDLNLTGVIPLAALDEWLISLEALRDISGRVGIVASIQGRLEQLRYTGHLDLQDINLRLSAWDHPITQLSGRVLLTPTELRAPQLSLHIDEQPLTATATWAMSEPPRLTASLMLPQGRVTLESLVRPHEFVIERAHLALPQSEFEVRGTYGRTPEQPSQLTARGVVELSELTQLPFLPWPALEPWRLRGRAELETQFRGHLAHWTQGAIRGRLRADQLSVREIPIEQLVGELEQQGGTLRLRIPSVTVAGGKSWVELALEHRGQTRNYLLQCDVVGLQLARLSEVVPAWRNRPVTGNASAHALLSGTWEQRATWKGEGWLKATGQELGNMPLLNKLFRGLFGVLADRFGLEMLRRAQITQVSVQWRLGRERFSTEDLRLAGLAGTEPVALYATGSVGFDQTLDFVIEPELSEGALLQGSATGTLAGTILQSAGKLDRFRRLVGRHRLTGTLKDPDYHFEFSLQEVFRQLAPADPGELFQNLLDVIR